MKQLIVNADDFGLHPVVNQAIIEGYTTGCITSTSLMPGAAGFEDALRLAAGYPELGVGVHLTLVGEKPVADRANVSSLLDDDGRLVAQYPQFVARFLLGGISLSEVRIELTAQIEKALASGLTFTHLDSHQHLHVLPGIIDIVLDLANQYGISAIRIPAEALFFTGGYPFTLGRLLSRCGLTVLARRAAWKAKRRGVRVPDHFFGMLAGGNMQEEYFLNIVSQLPTGTSEIMVHPGKNDATLKAAYGWEYHWQGELAAVTSSVVLHKLDEEKIKPVSFRELTYGEIL
jgi:hopanoid biosynthesis associated protein HpnK